MSEHRGGFRMGTLRVGPTPPIWPDIHERPMRRRRLPGGVVFAAVWVLTMGVMLGISYLDYRTVGLLVKPWNFMFGCLSALVATLVATAVTS